uniref:Tyr recombinase domain-containing protein n=1 Tax=Xenopus tropicalis TaxID=8364 RepID=A0A803JM14_XENTR
MGPQTHRFGLPSRIFLNAPYPILHVPPTSRSHQAGGSLVHCARTPQGKGDCTSSIRRPISRFLFQSLHRSQERRLLQTSSRSEAPQHLSTRLTFQDGVAKIGHCRHVSRRVLGDPGHKRRLSPCPHFPSALEILTLCYQESTLPVYLPSLRTHIGTQDLHQDHGGSSCGAKVSGGIHNPLPRRPPPQGSYVRIGDVPAVLGSEHPDLSGMEDQYHQVMPHSRSADVLPRVNIRHNASEGLPPTREDLKDAGHGSPPPLHAISIHTTGHAGPGHNGIGHRSCAICSIPPTTTPVEHPGPVEAHESVSTNAPSSQDQSCVGMVARQVTSIQGAHSNRAKVATSDYRCQSKGMGSGTTTIHSSGNLVRVREPSTHQYSGDQSGSFSPSTLAEPTQGTGGQDSIGQCHHSSLPQSSGRHKEPPGPKGGQPDTDLGRVKRSSPLSSLHPRTRKLAGRLPEQTEARSRRMGPKSQGIPGHCKQVGTSGGRPHGLVNKPPGTLIHGQVEFLTGVCLPSTSSHTMGSQEDQERTLPTNSDSSPLAQEGMVHRSNVAQQGRSLATSSTFRSTDPGSHQSSQACISKFDGMALESLVLSRKGFSKEVVKTMMAARRPVSAKAYHRVWKIYWDWCHTYGYPFQELSVPRILSFLQLGLDKGLSLGSLKSQISALSVLFQQKIATFPDVATFLEGVSRLHPPFHDPIPPWDLNLVLNALQEAPFEPMATIPIAWLTWKTVFLIAIASARRVSELSSLSCQLPYLIFHEDRAVLRTTASFLPKVVSSFHINQDITIPSFCLRPASYKEVALHSLDPVRALKFYLHRTKEIRSSNSLFILHTGAQSGSQASKSTISRWIKETICRAYIAKGKSPPLQIRAHSTRGIGTSWAFRNKASAEQVCKAATWSSLHSFTKFYSFEVFAASDALFGRKVLQAAVC